MPAANGRAGGSDPATPSLDVVEDAIWPSSAAGVGAVTGIERASFLLPWPAAAALLMTVPASSTVAAAGVMAAIREMVRSQQL